MIAACIQVERIFIMAYLFNHAPVVNKDDPIADAVVPIDEQIGAD